VEREKPLAGRYLSFVLDGEIYAVTVERVEVVLEMQAITRVPNTDAQICGVINHRGSVIPVIDLRIRFGQKPSLRDDSCSIVVLQVKYEGETLTAGMLADGVREVIDIDSDTLESTPRIGERKGSVRGSAAPSCVAGLARIDKDFIILLDIDATYANGPAILETAHA